MKPTKETARKNLFLYIAWTPIVLYFVYRLILIFIDPSPKGDEGFYLNEIAQIKSLGLWDTFVGGISHLYVTVWCIISFLPFNDLVMIRLINIILGLVSLCLINKIINHLDLSEKVRDLALLTAGYAIFVSQSGAMHYVAINDPMMNALGLAATLFLIRYLADFKVKDLIFTAVFSGTMFWVRSFAIILFGGIIAAVFIVPLLKKEKVLMHLAKVALFMFVFILIVLVVQVPSLMENQKLSFERKGGQGLGGWSHRNWLTQKEQISSGSVFAYKRVEWDFVDEYIETHGRKSIPHGVAGVFKDNPKLKTDITVVNLFFRIPYILLMSTGLLIFGLFRVVREPESWLCGLPPSMLALLAVFFSVCCGVSLAIINYIEHRWIFMASMMAIVLGAYSIQAMSEKWQKRFVCGQYVFIALITSVYLLKMLL